MCARQQPIDPGLNPLLKFGGSALDKISSPRMPSTNSKVILVTAEARTSASRLSERSGKLMTKTFSNYSGIRYGKTRCWENVLLVSSSQ